MTIDRKHVQNKRAVLCVRNGTHRYVVTWETIDSIEIVWTGFRVPFNVLRGKRGEARIR